MEEVHSTDYLRGLFLYYNRNVRLQKLMNVVQQLRWSTSEFYFDDSHWNWKLGKTKDSKILLENRISEARFWTIIRFEWYNNKL